LWSAAPHLFKKGEIPLFVKEVRSVYSSAREIMNSRENL